MTIQRNVSSVSFTVISVELEFKSKLTADIAFESNDYPSETFINGIYQNTQVIFGFEYDHIPNNRFLADNFQLKSVLFNKGAQHISWHYSPKGEDWENFLRTHEFVEAEIVFFREHYRMQLTDLLDRLVATLHLDENQ